MQSFIAQLDTITHTDILYLGFSVKRGSVNRTNHVHIVGAYWLLDKDIATVL
jgi:hypothetical protein